MNPDRNELRALFAALNDGTISTEDHARLEEILMHSEEARKLWFLHCDIETGMADWAAGRHATVIPFATARPSNVSGWSWRWLAAAAAVLLAAIWWMRPIATLETKATGVAVLARAVGVEWADGAVRTAGTVLAPGTLRLKSGAALVEFFSGARVVIEGPAEFRLVSAGEGFLHSGKINAHVPSQARGFTVSATDVKVVDYGTDFGVEIKADAPPEVHVFTGKVEVIAAQQPPRALNEGEAVRVDTASLRAIPAARSAFLTEEELVHRDNAVAHRRLGAWREASRALSADAATVVHYIFEETVPPGHTVTNHAASAPEDSHGSIVGCEWTTGRWPGKRALEFRTEGDRVRLIASSPMQAVTLLAWVRVNSLPRWQNVLLASDADEPGALHWHLTQPGELRLEIARELGRARPDWEAVNSQPFATSARLGQWMLLVTTFDGTTIRHYGNGRLIGSGASFTPPSLHIGAAALGNWRGGMQRNLAAAMDEFAILSRALSPEEIQALYDAGK